jgi:hypothetical protein
MKRPFRLRQACGLSFSLTADVSSCRDPPVGSSPKSNCLSGVSRLAELCFYITSAVWGFSWAYDWAAGSISRPFRRLFVELRCVQVPRSSGSCTSEKPPRAKRGAAVRGSRNRSLDRREVGPKKRATSEKSRARDCQILEKGQNQLAATEGSIRFSTKTPRKRPVSARQPARTRNTMRGQIDQRRSSAACCNVSARKDL